MTQDQKNTIERDFNESMLKDIEETKLLEEEKLREIPDMTEDEENAFENERQGGKSIFDDSEDLDDNQY
jgi:hypothetical protein